MANPYGSKLNLSDFGFSGAGGDGIAGAASTAQLGNISAQIRRNKPDYLGIMGANQEGYGMLKRQATKTDAEVHATGVAAEAEIKAAEIQAAAAKKAAADEARGSMIGSIIGAVGTIGGAVIGAAGGPGGAMLGAKIGGAATGAIG